MLAAIHVDAEIDRLADAQVAQLRFLEVGVDPDFVERADRHEVLADLNIVARIDVAPRDDAVDLGDDVAVTQVQFGLREVALRGFEFRLGLLDGRSVGRVLGERSVDVAQFIELIEHRFRTLVERVRDAELRGALNERRLGLEDGRKGLVEIGRRLAEVAASVRLRRQSEGDADLIDLGQRLGELRAGRRQRRLPLVVHLTRHVGAGEEFLRPVEFKLRQRQRGLALVDSGDPRVQQRDLVVDVLHGVLQVPAPAHGLRLDRARRRDGELEVGLRDVHRRLFLGNGDSVRLRVQLGEAIALAHAVVVVHQNAGNLSRHAGGDKRHVPIHEGVVGGDGIEHLLDPRDAEHDENRQSGDAEGAEQYHAFLRQLAGFLRRGVRVRRPLRGSRVLGSRSISIRRWLRVGRTWLVALLGHVRLPS